MSRARGSPVEPNPLALAADPSAARDARAWVAEVLTGWPDESVEVATLAVSELVTNSVLHAGTEIAVTYRQDGPRARFEVSDAHPAGPVPKRYSADSATGRGLRLVASLADAWGVVRNAQGKTVWFSVSPSTRAERTGTRTWEPTGQGASSHTGGEVPAGSVDVRVLGLPVDVYLEAEQHNDAVIRELALIVQSSRSSSGVEVPRRLLELAVHVQTVFASHSEGLRSQVEEAIRAGHDTVDIRMSVRREGWTVLLRLAEWLDEIDRYCVEGDLLTLEASPRLRRFRSWIARQVADQMEGLPPTPWEPGS